MDHGGQFAVLGDPEELSEYARVARKDEAYTACETLA